MPAARLTVPCVDAPPATAVTRSAWFASFGGPAVSFVNNDAAFIANDTIARRRHSVRARDRRIVHLADTIETVAGTDVACPSNTVNVNESGPK